MNGTFPPHPPAAPKCPPCFAVEPPPPEPSPPAVESLKHEVTTWCNCWNGWHWCSWCSYDCWQWCGPSQWKSYQHSWKSYDIPAKPHRHQTRQDWKRPKNNGNGSWYTWRSWTNNDSWRDGKKSSCCGCWQRRRAGSGGHHSRSSSDEAHLPCGLLAPSYADYSDLLFREITPEDYELLLRLDESVARPTASKEKVDSLPRARSEDAIGQVCTVCLDPFKASDNVLMLPACKHLFHKECVSKWLLERHRVCPLCNVEVFSASLN